MSAVHIRRSIENAIKHLKWHPEEARYTDSAARATIKTGLHCEVEGPGGAKLATDMPKEVGGSGGSPSPGWILRAALGSCDATVIAMRAAHEGVKLSKLEVICDSESDDRGLLGMDDSIRSGPLSMRTRVRIASPSASPELLRKIVKWAEAHSPVADAVRRAV